jgi:F-box protein 9
MNSDEENNSPLETINNDFRTVLDDFRERWQHELHNDQQQQQQQPLNEAKEVNQKEYDDEQKARTLFLQGVELEKQRKVFEAMSLYRKAVQLVPDIEFKIYERNKVQKVDQQQQQQVKVQPVEEDFEEDREVAEDEDENLDDVDLVVRFQDFVGKMGNFCTRSISNKTVISDGGGAHFGDLPVEIVLYILRWVVSSHLDMRSLEQSSLVCKGMYLCARDPEIWKLACLKVWGLNLGSLIASPFDSWRHMYLQRPRIHFNGCYISKTSYLRYGENSFQDQSYRPIQLVEYYRYLRFFPDGTCLMMTTGNSTHSTIPRVNRKIPFFFFSR